MLTLLLIGSVCNQMIILTSLGDLMNFRKACFLLLSMILLSLSTLLAITNTNPKPSPLLEKFANLTGFKGDVTIANDGRIFSKLTGTFYLPEPTDSLILQSNMDKIANALMSIYKEQGANYSLKRINYSDSTQTCQYLQYWKNFNLVHQPYYLLITYHSDTKSYKIYNSLYLKPIQIPDQVISSKTAKSIFNFIFDYGNLNTDLLSVPLAYLSTDIDNMQTLYDTDQDISIYLNLYPCSESNSNSVSEFCLQWKYPSPYAPNITIHGDYYIDAVTGELKDRAAKYFNKKLHIVSAVNECIREMGYAGNCSVNIFDDEIQFNDIKVPMTFQDTTCFRRFAEKKVTAIFKLYQKLGYDIKLGDSWARWNIERKRDIAFCEIRYDEIFRFQQEEEDSPFGLTAHYNMKDHALSFHANFLGKKIEYPEEILSSQTIFNIYKLDHKADYPEFKSIKSVERIHKDYVKTSSFPYHNEYHDTAHHLTARLCVQRSKSTHEGTILEMKLAWIVQSGKDYASIEYYQAANGHDLWSMIPDENSEIITSELSIARQEEQKAMEQSFSSLGTLSDCHFLSNTSKLIGFNSKLNLPVATDSTSAQRNFEIIIRLVMQHYLLNPSDFTNKPVHYDKHDWFRQVFTMSYKGYDLSQPENMNYYFPGNIDVSYDNDDNSYDVKFFMDYHILPIPEYVINPQSALALCSSNDMILPILTELSNLSGTKNYATHALFVPASESLYQEDFFGDISLMLSPIKSENPSIEEYEYKLIWSVQPYVGALYEIDAVTGEVLKHFEWDDD